jgi:hypothetical protein
LAPTIHRCYSLEVLSELVLLLFPLSFLGTPFSAIQLLTPYKCLLRVPLLSFRKTGTSTFAYRLLLFNLSAIAFLSPGYLK